MKFLVVEDEKTSTRLIESTLAPHGEVVAVPSSEVGFEKFMQALDSGSPFEAICLDIELPGVDGIELLAEIRRVEEERGIVGVEATKVLVTTAACNIDSYTEASSAGCTSFLCKPLSKQKLISELCRLGVVEQK